MREVIIHRKLSPDGANVSGKKENQQKRNYLISPKTSWKTLEEKMGRGKGVSNISKISQIVVEDSIKNLQELIGEKPGEKSDLISSLRDNTLALTYNQPIRIAIIRTLGQKIGFSIARTAVAMEWDLHQPEIVYMFASYGLGVVSDKLHTSQRLLDRAQTAEFRAIEIEGKNPITAEEAKENRIKELEEEIKIFAGYTNRLEKVTSEYEQEHMKPKIANQEEYDAYRQVLQMIPLHLKIKTGGLKDAELNSILKNMKAGNYQKALTIFQDGLPPISL